MIAGWVRTVGHVTPVVTLRLVVAPIAPITDQTNGLSPCRSIQGWKWSLMSADRHPACSACWAVRTRAVGPCSSLDRKIPNSVMVASYPAHALRKQPYQRSGPTGAGG